MVEDRDQELVGTTRAVDVGMSETKGMVVIGRDSRLTAWRERVLTAWKG